MKTVADFKRKMIVGSKWKTLHRFKDAPAKDLGVRECVIAQSNSFALATPCATGVKPSWCDFPKAKEVTFIDENTININFGYGDLTYQFVE